MQGAKAYRVYLFLVGASTLVRMMIYIPLAVYYVRTIGMSPLQLVLVGTTIEATCFLFQVPTGVIADLYSRRLSVVIGHVLVGVGFVMEGFLPAFVAILLAEVVRGVGETCIDGALEAWIVDEVGDDELQRVFLRGGQVGAAASIVGPFLGAGLATISLALPVALGGGLLIVLAVALRVMMPETGFHPVARAERGSLRRAAGSMVATAREGATVVRGRPLLVMMLLVTVVYGAHSEVYDRLWEAHLLNDLGLPGVGRLDPVIWFGIIGAASAVVGIVAAQVIGRRIDARSDATAARVLLVINVIRIGSVLLFALAGSFTLAVAALLLSRGIMAVSYPIAGAWMNRQIDSRIRATVLSVNSQADALGQVGGGPAIGALGNVFSIRVALAACGLVLTPTLWLYGRAVRGGGRAVVGETEGESLGVVADRG